MFNDSFYIHRLVKDVINKLNIDISLYVFERGYIRPNFITFEKDGVNGNSKLPKDPNSYRNYRSCYRFMPYPVKGEDLYWYFYSVLFFLFYIILYPFFPASKLRYTNIFKASIGYIFNVFKKNFYKLNEKPKVKFILNSNKSYYFLPLQVYNDSQLRFHSPYKSIKEFIQEVLISFSYSAPPDTLLVFKHHPMDIGFVCYKTFIENLTKQYGISERVIYLKNGDIDTLVKKAIGIITINSTVGMTALLHRKPVKVMGKAVYDIEGLTFKGSLDEFWREATNFRVDEDLLHGFFDYLFDHVLINGSFYKRISNKTHTGLIYNSSHL
ncbi:MAG: capsular biosynthesis protein [Elusimicrobiota bacterium]|nr:capsular biosynthesis protein [Endomicrobiia bacterium]MDW7998802.1 capsular biosynthesis protein [Thermodesulfovibrio sp.]MDW8165899.1 capsular biosynthesis protein [Elusimicrobiota bacterium]